MFCNFCLYNLPSLLSPNGRFYGYVMLLMCHAEHIHWHPVCLSLWWVPCLISRVGWHWYISLYSQCSIIISLLAGLVHSFRDAACRLVQSSGYRPLAKQAQNVRTQCAWLWALGGLATYYIVTLFPWAVIHPSGRSSFQDLVMSGEIKVQPVVRASGSGRISLAAASLQW